MDKQGTLNSFALKDLTHSTKTNDHTTDLVMEGCNLWVVIIGHQTSVIASTVERIDQEDE